MEAVRRNSHRRNQVDKITTTIKRQWLCEIIAGRKKVEYRSIKPYWNRRLAAVKAPFVLRLINGMDSKAPEATVVITRIRKNKRAGLYELSIGKLIGSRNWDRKRERPSTT